MIGHVFINGLIGSNRDETGKVIEKGVELQDVISQFQLNKGSELIHVHINSEGGSVDEGKRIAAYLKSHSNVVTIAEILCASIATEIHLSVPLERRKIATGTRYIIHQPMISLQRGVALNQTQLDELSEDIAGTEKEMLSMYQKATGLDKTALSLLMKKETDMTPEQCKEYGFVSEILAPSEFKAVALITRKPKTNNDMSSLLAEIKKLGQTITEAVKGKEPKKLALKCKKIALDLTTTDGVDVIVVTEDTMPKVGDMVTTADGTAVEDGTYQFEQGQLVVKGGKVEEVLAPAEVEVDTALVELQKKYDALVAEREAEKTALTELTGQVAELTKIARLSKSTYDPKPVKTAFKKVDEDKGDDKGKALKELREKRKAEAAKK